MSHSIRGWEVVKVVLTNLLMHKQRRQRDDDEGAAIIAGVGVSTPVDYRPPFIST